MYIPENIHTLPTQGQWKYQGGGGGISKRSVWAKLEFPEGWGYKPKTLCIMEGWGGGMDNFLNHTFKKADKRNRA